MFGLVGFRLTYTTYISPADIARDACVPGTQKKQKRAQHFTHLEAAMLPAKSARNAAFGTDNPEGADFRACETDGPSYG